MFSDLRKRLSERPSTIGRWFDRRKRNCVEVGRQVPYSLNPRVHGRGNKTSASKRKRHMQHLAHESRRRNFQA
jgi:hypothetical protein